MGINVRAKGAGGEREFCGWLERTLKLDHKLTRDLEQVRSGGADITCLSPFLFEVKRCEALAQRAWWLQVMKAARAIPGSIPVVCFRQNRQPWRFLLSASYIGLQNGYIQLEEQEFTNWIKNYYRIS